MCHLYLLTLLVDLSRRVTVDDITWTGNDLPAFYQPVLDLVAKMNGILNFNDALMAILCQELGIDVIVSFDRDFDLAPWLKRIADPQDL